MIDVVPLPAFKDNYIWAWLAPEGAVVVDPGDAEPVRAWLGSHGARLQTILVTHWHPDHTGGIDTLVSESGAQVYGPAAEAARIPGPMYELRDGDTVETGGLSFRVIEVPGHTSGHIAFYADTAPPLLFCGDTLFHTGCGRLFEGTPQQMHTSLSRLMALPDDTLVYCTHEYTLANLAFARQVEPTNPLLAEVEQDAKTARSAGRPTLPTTIGAQRRFNPFLRSDDRALRAAIAAQSGSEPQDAIDTFAQLRALKDRA